MRAQQNGTETALARASPVAAVIIPLTQILFSQAALHTDRRKTTDVRILRLPSAFTPCRAAFLAPLALAAALALDAARGQPLAAQSRQCRTRRSGRLGNRLGVSLRLGSHLRAEG